LSDLFELLRDKQIIAILDGDTSFEEYEFSDGETINIRMPYLSGPDLCGLSTRFGLPVTYSWGGVNLSRWQYLDNLIAYCIEENRCSDLLAFLFRKEQFINMLSGHEAEDIDSAYQFIVNKIIGQINGLLYFGGNEIAVIGTNYVIRKIGSKVEVVTPQIKNIDRDYIRSISARALQDVDENNYDSAITKSRTLLEETFCYVIEKKGDIPSDSGDMGKLFKQVKDLYNMHTDSNTERRINTLYSGLNSIVSSIAEMRNKDSDAHGVGANRIAIDEHHARLFVNAAMAMADFILSVQMQEK
jgi:hypothetical protein